MKYKLPTTIYIEKALSLSVGADYDNSNHPLSVNSLNFYNFTNWRSAEGYPIPPNPQPLDSITPINSTPLLIPPDYQPNPIYVTFKGSSTPTLIGYEYILKFQQGTSVNWDIAIDVSDSRYILISTPNTDTTITATALMHSNIDTNGNITDSIPLFYISHDDLIINSTRIVFFHIKNEFYVPQYYLQ